MGVFLPLLNKYMIKHIITIITTANYHLEYYYYYYRDHY